MFKHLALLHFCKGETGGRERGALSVLLRLVRKALPCRFRRACGKCRTAPTPGGAVYSPRGHVSSPQGSTFRRTLAAITASQRADHLTC